MNNRTANIFDAWIINQHNRLKERIASSTMFDDDAFQETYLTMREALTIKDIELDFEPVFIKLYRRMLARELSTEFRYSHPDPLFFVLLRSDEENPEEIGQTPGYAKDCERTIYFSNKFIANKILDASKAQQSASFLVSEKPVMIDGKEWFKIVLSKPLRVN